MVASLGLKVAKLSGRSLGHTGGTIDKLEAIPGFKTDLQVKDFYRIANEVGIVVAGQTANIAPADKKNICFTRCNRNSRRTFINCIKYNE